MKSDGNPSSLTPSSRRLRRWTPAVAALLLVATPYLFPISLGFLVVLGVFFLVVLGLDVFLGQTGQVSLGQTLFMGLGAYVAGILALNHGVPTVVALAVAASVSAGVAYLVGRPLLKLRGYYLALATLGLAVITESLATGLVDVTGGPSGLAGIPNIAIGPFVASSDLSNYYIVLVVCAAGAFFVHGVRRSPTGRALAAVAADQQAASMLGIDAARYKTRAFVIAAVFASVGGSLYAFYSRFVSPDMVGVIVAFNLVVMLALGGSRSIVGPFLGVLLLQVMPQLGQSVALYQPLIAGIVLIVVITYLPEGIWGGLKSVLGKRFS